MLKGNARDRLFNSQAKGLGYDLEQRKKASRWRPICRKLRQVDEQCVEEAGVLGVDVRK